MNHHNDQGSATLEAVILVPGLLLFLGLLIMGGRVWIAHNSVEQAAEDAARTASISRTATQARTTAQTEAMASLRRQGLQCATTNVTVDTSGFAVPVGQPAQVTATVTCQVSLGDLGAPFPGTRTVTATATSPLDTYRGRQ